jgi:hypothetical protein
LRVATTFALATTLLVLSTTVPEMSPDVAWGKAVPENRTKVVMNNKQDNILPKRLARDRWFIVFLLRI